jgi:RNA polymerase sigma-70 factor (ECF subfamily)
MDSFQDFYVREQPRVFRAAFLLAGDPALAEDATQEAFARALERWRRLRDASWAGGWVMTTALNVVRRGLRRRRIVTSGARAQAYEQAQADLDLWRAVRGLSKRQQEAVVLHYVGDLSVADCAAAMGCDVGTVKTHLSRARQELNDRLGGEYA